MPGPDQAPDAQPQQEPQDDQGAPQGDQQQGPQAAMQAMMGVKSAMEQIAQAVQGKMPPPVMKALMAAANAYAQFLAGAEKALGVQSAPDMDGDEGQQQSDMSSGSKSAVSGDSMAGGNPNAKPMY